MNDLDKAREWAGRVYAQEPDTQATCRVIQSLPDQWIDAEKVREIYDRYRASEIALHEAFRAAVALATPPLQTLAELIEAGNDPKQYKWMQADLNVLGDTYRVVILNFVNEWADCMRADGARATQRLEDITPLPDLPKLEWPGDGVGDAPIVDGEPALSRTEEAKPGDYRLDSHMGNSAVTALPRPEDVPVGEPWIVRHEEWEWIGVRSRSEESPWSIIRTTGIGYGDEDDADITLVSRLVPEVKP